MTEAHEDNAPAAIGDSPGQYLAQARQGRGLSVERVAIELHLKPATLAAVEEDAYDRLPSAVFVSGYIRAYARLLEIDPQPLIERFHRLHPNAEPPPPRVTADQIRSSSGGHLLARLLVLGLALGAIAGLGYWASMTDWSRMEQAQAPTASDASATGPLLEPQQSAAAAAASTPPAQPAPVTTAPAQDSPADATDPATATDAPILPQPPATSTDTQVATTPGPSAGVDPESMTTVADTEAEDADDASRAAEPEPEPSSAATVDDASAPPSPEEDIVLAFSGPCWVDVRDADGNVELFGEMADGDRRVLAGRAPFSLILGNAAAAEVQVGGRVFDITAIAQGNVARFDLDPAELPAADDAAPAADADPSD